MSISVHEKDVALAPAGDTKHRDEHTLKQEGAKKETGNLHLQAPPPCTDAGNAELFAALVKNSWRYDYRRGLWLKWKGHWWSPDKDGGLYRSAKTVVRQRARIASSLGLDDDAVEAHRRWARKSESYGRLEAMLKLAAHERALADSGENWDKDPLLLGVANGVVDLRTGQLREGYRSDRITKHTSIPFHPGASAPRWMQFLREIFSEDEELISFVQRAVGYSLTGSTSEQCFFACFGTGSNGKTTFLEVLRYVVGDYGANTPFSTLELGSRNVIPNDVAALEGRRLVTASETGELIRLNEARVKSLTGEDAVTARFLHREFFTFQPVAKIWLAFNHKPLVGDDSPGFWRRVRVIPFTAQFHSDQIEKGLVHRLKAEAPGILAWAVEGCLKWQKDGLGTAEAVEAATRAYREEMDLIGRFLGECCEVGPTASVSAADLWLRFQSWNCDYGEKVSRRTFAQKLTQRGFRKERRGHARIWTWIGIGLRGDDDDQ